MSSSRTLSRKRRTSFTCIKPRFGPSIILLYIAASVEQYCDITQLNALPENEGILELQYPRPRWIFHLNQQMLLFPESPFDQNVLMIRSIEHIGLSKNLRLGL